MLPHASPVVLDKLSLPLNPRKLTRNQVFTPGSAAKFPEKLLQELIHSDPGILPVEPLGRGLPRALHRLQYLQAKAQVDEAQRQLD
jgi:hypothetical protein